jgi:hypothetical protein
MSRLYSKLAKLQRELMNAKSAEEREDIEDQIADVEMEIELEEDEKYKNDNDY